MMRKTKRMSNLPKCPKCQRAVRIKHETNNRQPLVTVTCEPCRLKVRAPDINAAFRQLAKHSRETFVDGLGDELKPLPHLSKITTKLKEAPKDHERFQDSQGD